MDFIKGFETDEYRFLSNFYDSPVEVWGVLFPTAEHAYQAAKAPIASEVFLKISEAGTAAEAKKLGRSVSLSSNWEEVKFDKMYDVVEAKFKKGSELANKLLNTGDVLLEETNWWKDTYWGVCNEIGENNLGKILMGVRENLKEEINK